MNNTKTEIQGFDQFEEAKNAIEALGKTLQDFNRLNGTGINMANLAAVRQSYIAVRAEVDAVDASGLTEPQLASLQSMKRTLALLDGQIKKYETVG